MSSIVVKAYWKKLNGGAEEIRRFSVDHDVSTSYAYLTEKIRLAFPSLRSRDLTTCWKDSDGDLITFSNDDDLMDALSHNVDKDLFRIYIEDVKPMSSHCPPMGGTKCPPTSFGGLHPGVMCDGCDGPLFGTRYKCTVCPDYDLCTPCKSTGLHGEHQFKDIQDLPLQNMFAEAMKLYQQATASGCAGRPCGEGGLPEWMRGCRMPAPQNPNPQDKGNPTTASAADGAKDAGCRSNDECEQRKKQQEFLKNIGTFAAGLLNPFGFTSESDVKLTKEDANSSSSSSQSAKKEMRSDQNQEGGCQGREAGSCQSGNHTTARGNAPGEAQPSTSSAHESGGMGHSPKTSFGGLHPGVMCDGCDGPVFGTRFKCTVCPDYDLCTPCKSTGLHGEHQFRDIQAMPFQNMFAEAMKLYQQATTSGCAGGPCGERGHPEWMRGCRMPAPQNPNPQNKGNPTAASAAEGAKDTGCRSNDECEQRKKQQEFLKNIGTFAAGLLNPFGFTSESDVKLTKEDANSSSSQSAKKEMRSDQNQEGGGCQGREAGSCQSGNHTTARGNAPGEAQPSTSSAHESGEMGHSPKTSAEGSSTPNIHSNKEDQADTAGQTASSSNEQAVRACLQTLKEMGFSDDGGWLTSLVNVYQGIITHVLDAIQANQNQ